jgi:hypothetical protein
VASVVPAGSWAWAVERNVRNTATIREHVPGAKALFFFRGMLRDGCTGRTVFGSFIVTG